MNLTIEHVIIIEITLYCLIIISIFYQIGRLIHSHYYTKRKMKELLSGHEE